LLAAAVCVVALAASPAHAIFPVGHSATLHNAAGFVDDCVNFRNCNKDTCPAQFLFANKSCSYTKPTADVEPGVTETTITCNNVNLAGFNPTRTATYTCRCDRNGSSNWFWVEQATGSCACSALYEGILIPGGRVNLDDSLSTVFIAGVAPNGRGTCEQLFVGRPNAPLVPKSVR
jgi:hypothetical protein